MLISMCNELNANASRSVLKFCGISTESEIEIGSRWQELYVGDFSSPQIGLLQQHKLDRKMVVIVRLPCVSKRWSENNLLYSEGFFSFILSKYVAKIKGVVVLVQSEDKNLKLIKFKVN